MRLSLSLTLLRKDPLSTPTHSAKNTVKISIMETQKLCGDGSYVVIITPAYQSKA